MNRIFMLVLLGAGGLIGTVARYLVSLSLANFKIFGLSFPYGTFIVNIMGCFLIGIFYGISQYRDWFNTATTLFLITGFCGGFTTFSSFSYENIELIQRAEYLTFAVYSIASFSLGLLAVFSGLMMVRYLF